MDRKKVPDNRKVVKSSRVLNVKLKVMFVGRVDGDRVRDRTVFVQCTGVS